MEPAGEAERGRAREEEEEEEGEPGGSSSSGDSDSETLAFSLRRVSFADAFGLNLVSVKEFSSRAPDVSRGAPNPSGPDSEEYFLRAQFSVPASNSDLLAKLQAQMCELECVELLPGTTTLRGIIRVLNLCYDKTVCVRTSLDGWGTHFDLPADFIPGSSDGETDRFTFSLDLRHPFPPDGARVEFCLRYETPLGTFWANNNGVNYVLFCQQRGRRDGKGRHCEDSSLRNKKSCLKHNSKEKSTEANPPVISAETADVPDNKQEVVVSKKTEQPASISDELQDDSCQKSLVECGCNLSRRNRRRAARLAQIRDRFQCTAARAQPGDAPAQDCRDADGRADTDTDAGCLSSEISTPPSEGACGIWDWNQTDWEGQDQAHDEIAQHSPQAEAEGPPLSLPYATDVTVMAPERLYEISHLSTGTGRWSSADAFVSVEDGHASAYATASVSHTPQSELWELTAPQGTLGGSDTPWDAPRDSPQEALLESAATLSEGATGHENSKSPQAKQEDPVTQEQAVSDISTSMQDYLGTVVTDGKDGDQQHSQPISGDRASMEGQDSNNLRPQSDKVSDTFKFETFVAPLYHQAFCRSRPESQDITGELWAGDQVSDDSDDEGQVGSTDSCSRLTAIVDTQPPFPFGSYTPPVDQLGCLGDILELAPDNSLSTHVSTSPFLENSGPGAEIISHDRVHRAAQYSDRDVPPEIDRQDKEHGEHLFIPKAVEGILTQTDTKIDATATIATLAPSVTNDREVLSIGDCSTIVISPANTETVVKGDELRGDHVIFTQGVGETGFFTMLMEKKVSLEEGKIVSVEKEEDFNKTGAVSMEYEGLYGEWLEDLDDELSIDVQDILVENYLDNDKVSVEDEDLYGDNLKENEDLDVSVKYENINDDEASVEEEIDKFLSAKNEDLDDDEVSVEDEELEKNIFVENEDLYGDNLNENEDLNNEELPMEDAELVRLENEDLYSDNLKGNEGLDVSAEQEGIHDDDVSVKEETDKFLSTKNKDLDDDKLSVDEKEFYRDISVDNNDLYDENVIKNEGVNDGRLPVENKDLDEAGEKASVSKDLNEVKSKASRGQKDDLYDVEEVFFIETKDEHHNGESETLQEREELDEGVGVVFREQECCLDLKADALIREDVHPHMDRTVPGVELDRHVREAGEVYKEEGKQSQDRGEHLGKENPEAEMEEDSVSTDSLTDDEMELHMRSVKSAHKQQLCRTELGNGRAGSISGGNWPSLSRAWIPLTALSSISESVNEDGDTPEEESGLVPVETTGDCGAIKLPPVEKVENAARTYLSSWRETFSLSNLWRACLYALVCVLFFFTAYHYDFLACFTLYLFSLFWLCFRGEKQGLQGGKREE